MDTTAIAKVLIASVPCAAAALSMGCTSTSKHYWTSRALDLWDVMPVSVQTAFGAQHMTPPGGLCVSSQVTPFAQAGLGFYTAKSYGMALVRWGPYWEEMEFHLSPLLSLRFHGIEREQEETTWPGGPDGRYQYVTDEYIQRRPGNVFVAIPVVSQDHPDPELTPRLPAWYAWPDSEAQVFLGIVGVRVGVAPAQAIDFVLGWTGLDLFGDDCKPWEDSETDAPPGSSKTDDQ